MEKRTDETNRELSELTEAELAAVSGGYTFENVYARRCLDVLDYRSDDGAPLQIWDCTGATNQIFF